LSLLVEDALKALHISVFACSDSALAADTTPAQYYLTISTDDTALSVCSVPAR